MKSTSITDGKFVPSHPRVDTLRPPAGAAGPFKAVRAQGTTQGATPEVSQLSFEDGKTFPVPSEASTRAWEAIPNRSGNSFDKLARFYVSLVDTLSPNTTKIINESISNISNAQSALTAYIYKTPMPLHHSAQPHPKVLGCSIDVSNALDPLATPKNKPPALPPNVLGWFNDNVSDVSESPDSMTTPRNKPSVLHHPAQPFLEQVGVLTHSQSHEYIAHPGTPVPPAYAASPSDHCPAADHANDPDHVLSWQATLIVKTGLEHLKSSGPAVLTDYLFGIAFQDCKMASIVAFAAHNILQQARTWRPPVTPDPAHVLRAQILRLHREHWSMRGWMARKLPPRQGAQAAMKGTYVGGLIGSLFTVGILTPDDIHSSIQVVLETQPTFNGLCTVHALITHCDSRICAPEFHLVIASHKAMLTGPSGWARDSTGHVLIQEIEDRLNQWMATQELNMIRASVDPAEAQSGGWASNGNMFANRAGTQADRNRLRENSPVHVGPSCGGA